MRETLGTASASIQAPMTMTTANRTIDFTVVRFSLSGMAL